MASCDYTARSPPPPPLVNLVMTCAQMVVPGKLILKEYLQSLPSAPESPPHNTIASESGKREAENEQNQKGGHRGVTGAGDLPVRKARGGGGGGGKGALVKLMRELVQGLQEVLAEVDEEEDKELSALSSCSSSTRRLRESSLHDSPLLRLSSSEHACGESLEEYHGVEQALPYNRTRSRSPPAAAPAQEAVMSNTSLLSEIFGFLLDSAGHPNESKAQLCCLGAVSKSWADVTQLDGYWRPVALALFPVLALRPPAENSTYRDFVTQYGRCLVHRTVQDGDNWQANLLLSFEIYDESDGARLFSSMGPVELILSSESGLTAIRLTGTKRTETSRPFTAASRDPRFTSMREYFTQPSDARFSNSICVRVVAMDVSTGRRALLYKSSKKTQRSSKVSTLQYWQQWLTPGSLFIWEPWSRWSVGPGLQELVEISTSFYISPIPGLDQADVAEQDVQHIIMGGDTHAYSDHNSFIALQFRTLDAGIPGRFISSALSSASSWSSSSSPAVSSS